MCVALQTLTKFDLVKPKKLSQKFWSTQSQRHCRMAGVDDGPTGPETVRDDKDQPASKSDPASRSKRSRILVGILLVALIAGSLVCSTQLFQLSVIEVNCVFFLMWYRIPSHID